jgi:hypothetical protein
MHEKILQELEGFQLAIEVLKSRGFSARFCWPNTVSSALPLEKGRTPVLSATPWITDSTTVQNIVIIAIVSNIIT